MRPRELGRAGKLEALRDGLYRRRAGFAPGAGGPGRAAASCGATREAEVGRGGRALSDSARAYLRCVPCLLRTDFVCLLNRLVCLLNGLVCLLAIFACWFYPACWFHTGLLAISGLFGLLAISGLFAVGNSGRPNVEYFE